MKIRVLIGMIVAVLLLVSMASAAEKPGILNIITDMEDTYIYIDGENVGKGFIKNYEVSPGSHYIVVNKGGKKIYADTIYIYPGEVTTIPTAHFVDIKTTTPNRGALEVEAARIKETRGSGAFGVYVGTPAGGLSFKWWAFEPFGVQILGYTEGSNVAQDNQFGGRLLYSLGTKIFLEQPVEAYWALGVGTKTYDDKTPANNDYTSNVTELAVGIEFGIGNIFFSGETGVESVNRSGDASTNMKLSGGIHYYF
ncbi:PEGA domain-containing protein [Candidatus Margulisiibacteriota bacterium]